MAVVDPPALALTAAEADAPPSPPTSPSPVLPEPRTVVLHAPQRRRFEVHVGGRLAGFTEYFETDDRRVFVHTEVGQAFCGRGLASAVVREALEVTRAQGKRVAAICPYVTRWLSNHPGYEDLVAPPLR